MMVYDPPHGDIFEGHSIKIVLPPKPGFEDSYNMGRPEAKMDVCSLTLSCLAQDPNLPSSKLPFAWKLYEMLENVHKNGVDTDIVSWVDDGNAFKVHDLKKFVDAIVPTYFKQSKYKSFQRQLYFYGFTRVTSSAKRGQTAGSYRHPKFLRGKKTLCLSMVPKKNKKRSSNILVAATVVENTKEPQQTQQDIPPPSVAEAKGIPRRVSVEVEDDSVAVMDDTTPIPLLRSSTSTTTVRTVNGTARAIDVVHDGDIFAYHHQHCDHRVTSASYVHQQNQLQRLQREQFYSYLNQQDPQQQPQQEQQGHVPFYHREQTQQQQWARVGDEQPCCIFGGKAFHYVSKKSYSEPGNSM